MKNHPVDFLVLPFCDGTSCQSNGEYANDMDSAWDLTGVMNNMTIFYSHDVANPDILNIMFESITNATKFNFNVINDNDELGIVQIYNAKSMSLDKNYTVTATFMNNTVADLPNEAYYDAFTDRLVTQNHNDHIWLSELDYLTLKKKV